MHFKTRKFQYRSLFCLNRTEQTAHIRSTASRKPFYANSVDPYQAAVLSSLISVYTVCIRWLSGDKLDFTEAFLIYG